MKPPRKPSAKRKKLPFPLFFALYTLTCLAVTGAGLFLLWSFLDQYETNSPTRIAASAAQQIALGDYSLLWESPQLAPDRFNSRERLSAWLEDCLEGKRISSRGLSGEEGVYELTADGEPFARLEILPQGHKNLFGGQPHQIEGVETQLPMTQTFTLTAPEEAQVTVNGVPLTREDAQGDPAPLAAYDGLPDGYEAPRALTYQVGPLAGEPEITARLEGGGDCAVKVEGSSAAVSAPAGQELRDQIGPIAQEASHLYARFITQDAVFDQLAPYLLTCTDYYQKVAGFYNGWYISHDSYSFGETTLSNFLLYSPDHLSCDIAFDYQVVKGSKTYDFPSSYTLYYIRTAGGWKIANMTVR